MPAILELIGVNLTEAPWREAESYLQEIARRERIDPATLDPLSTYDLLQEAALGARDPALQASLDSASVFLLDRTLNGSRQLAHLLKGHGSLSPVLAYLQFLVEGNGFSVLQKYIDALPEPLLWRIYATQIYDPLMSVSFARDLTDAHVAAARRHLESTGGSGVLDIGAGTGLVAEALAIAGIPVVAVEPNSAMAEHLKRRLSGLANVEIHRDLFERVNLERRRFDVINLRNVLYLIEDPEVFMRKVFSYLSPGGKVLISGPMPNGQDILPLLARDTFAELAATGREKDVWRFALVGPINKRLLNSAYVRPADEVAGMLRRVGFEVGEGDVDTQFYRGSTYLIQATRPQESPKMIPDGGSGGIVNLDESVGAGSPRPHSSTGAVTAPLRRTPWRLRGARTGVMGRTFPTRAGRVLRVMGM